jgi:hypothetical protein
MKPVMHVRTCLVFVLVLLSLGMGGWQQDTVCGVLKSSTRPYPKKVVPLSLRYRQQINLKIRLLARTTPVAVRPTRTAPSPSQPLEAVVTRFPSGIVLLHVYARLQV